MSAKRPTTSNLGGGGGKPKKIRMSLSLESKLSIVKRHEDGEGVNNIARTMGLAQSTVSTVIKNSANIKIAGKSNTTLMAKKITRQREPIYEEMERLLMMWIDDNTGCHVSLSTTLITNKALSIWKDLKKKDYKVKEGTKFTASKGWFERFRNRTSLYKIKLTGEATSSDVSATSSDVSATSSDVSAVSSDVFAADEFKLTLVKKIEEAVQPLNEGIFSTFKANYQRLIMKQLLDVTHTPDKQTIKQFWSNYNIKKAIDNIDAAWKEVSDNTMNVSWRKLWKDCVTDFTGCPDLKDVRKDLVRLSHIAGFNEVDEEDIQQLFDSHEEPLSNEDLIQIEQQRTLADQEDNDDEPKRVLGINELREAFQHIEKGMELLREYDFNPARSAAATQAVEQGLKPYKNIYETKRRHETQTTTSSFFKPNPPSRPSTPSTSTTDPLSPDTKIDISPDSLPYSPDTKIDISPDSLPYSPDTKIDISHDSLPNSPDTQTDSQTPTLITGHSESPMLMSTSDMKLYKL
ncbi:hypothetical protein Pmani_016911 [Petrolisthes manimaculis]|uniref:HTH CENPB-type domain-containing protein n=1 Tax=Petrolisthes manimaculis TaxID=1843537 RepID=A0AAE1PQK4_9EUCA|nr:hypothetical protein Pmani_016911 [Petrolisthes manimaculis]